MRKSRVAVIASGEGTTAEAFIRAAAAGRINAAVELIICNNAAAGIFRRIANLNRELGLSIRCVHIGHRNYPPKKYEKLQAGNQTRSEEQAIMKILSDGRFDAICLMGYLKKIGPALVARFGDQPGSSRYGASMLNTHPGLLPETKGLWGRHVQEFVLANGLSYAGQTLHTVSKNYDEGAIIAEHKIKVHAGDDPDSLFEKVKTIEKRYLPSDVDNFINLRRAYLKDKES